MRKTSSQAETETIVYQAIRSSDWRDVSLLRYEPFVQLVPFLAATENKLIEPWGSIETPVEHQSDDAKVTFQWCSEREGGLIKNLSPWPIAFVLRDVDGRKFVCGDHVPPELTQVVELPARRQHGQMWLNIKGKLGNIGQTSTARH
jgi:hypothetical protein